MSKPGWRQRLRDRKTQETRQEAQAAAIAGFQTVLDNPASDPDTVYKAARELATLLARAAKADRAEAPATPPADPGTDPELLAELERRGLSVDPVTGVWRAQADPRPSTPPAPVAPPPRPPAAPEPEPFPVFEMPTEIIIESPSAIGAGVHFGDVVSGLLPGGQIVSSWSEATGDVPLNPETGRPLAEERAEAEAAIAARHNRGGWDARDTCRFTQGPSSPAAPVDSIVSEFFSPEAQEPTE